MVSLTSKKVLNFLQASSRYLGVVVNQANIILNEVHYFAVTEKTWSDASVTIVLEPYYLNKATGAFQSLEDVAGFKGISDGEVNARILVANDTLPVLYL